jgi:hypothetical protein
MMKIFGSIFLTAILLFGCRSVKQSAPQSTFSINGKECNECIKNRTPDYGIDNKDGCIILGEISLSLIFISIDSIAGVVVDSKTAEPIPIARVKFIQKTPEGAKVVNSDSLGEFQTRLTNGLKRIQIEYIGYRTLLIDLNSYYEIE